MAPPIAPPLTTLLRCPGCGGGLDGAPGALRCAHCGAAYPVRAGTVRMVRGGAGDPVRRRTGRSFAYEWERFGAPRPEWRRNFADYVRPLDEAWFAGRLVLDVGAGSGRHSRRAAELGARVVATDLGDAIDVARRNVPADVLTVQCDAEELPFARDAFDLVMSIGVLHHLPDTARALRAIVPFARPGGRVHVYLYWMPPVHWHRAVLAVVSAVRRLTTRLPHRLLHLLCWPLAAALHVAVVAPYRGLRRRPRGRRLAAALPLKAYADYPFGVLVNDQFDRLSAPIEQRFTAAEVRDMLLAAGLEDVEVLANNGWIGSGVRSAAA